jgi:hypothetical protein
MTLKQCVCGSAALAAAAAVLLITGCAQVKLGAVNPSIENIQAAKASGMPPVAVGTFVLAEGVPRSVDEAVSIRSNRFFSPYDSSFTKYLQETLAAELRAAGLLDANAATRITGQLTRSEVEAGTSSGTASLGAWFVVHRSDVVVYRKQLVEQDTWPSSFVGAVAIPDAANHYAALYRRLVAHLLTDEDFRKAMKP